MQSWVHVPTGTRGIAIGGSYDETSFHVIPRIDRNRSKATPQYLDVVACTHNSNCTFSQVSEPATTWIQWSVHHILHASEDTRCSAMRANNIRMLYQEFILTQHSHWHIPEGSITDPPIRISYRIVKTLTGIASCHFVPCFFSFLSFYFIFYIISSKV